VKIGSFELKEPAPELTEPHALAIIPTWIDAGKSASLALSRMEEKFGKTELARLSRPGEFFDFTRYRPTISRQGETSTLNVTNAVLTYGEGDKEHDFIFLRLPEPHMKSEEYVISVVEVLKHFHVKRYGLLGSFYDMVPYTRPLLITGAASNEWLQDSLAAARVLDSDYEGATSILSLIGQYAGEAGIETFSALAHLPGYFTPDEDYRGEKGLMDVLGSLYDIRIPVDDIEKADNQDEQLRINAEQYLEQQPQLRFMLKQLEDNYDARTEKKKDKISLSPEVERFLKELNGRFGPGLAGE
jgi:predicted ATP-grasp superfamily ATP-dependent carboligase